MIEKLQQFEFWGGERNLVNIKSGEFGYSQAYVHAANAKAREDALLGALKLTVRYMEYLHGEAGCSLDCCDCVLAGDYAAVKDCIREIEATRD